MRRETYRRALNDGIDLERLTAAPASRRPLAHAQQLHPMHRPVPTRFPRSALMRALIDHPVLCALGVAAIVAIGPRRIMKTVADSAATVGALTARNESNVDLLGKVLAMAGAYAQEHSDKQHI